MKMYLDDLINRELDEIIGIKFKSPASTLDRERLKTTIRQRGIKVPTTIMVANRYYCILEDAGLVVFANKEYFKHSDLQKVKIQL